MESKKNLKFFIVDDDFFVANVYQQYLFNLHYTDITYFSNGEDCLENLHLEPDIILLDHNMDEITGFDVLKKIKRYNPNIYVVMVSGQEDIQVAVEALKYGAFDYLVKDNEVCEKIKKTIERIIFIQNEIENSATIKKILRFFSLF